KLYQLRERQDLKVVLVTSALAREGKSFVAANLAHVLALQPECKVLLIDADLRNPTLHHLLGTSTNPGLSDYLQDEKHDFDILQKGDYGTLFLIPAGRPVPGPSELVSSRRFRSLIQRLVPHFDWVIIDSPAATAYSDACLVSDVCDGVLMVVQSASTPFNVV